MTNKSVRYRIYLKKFYRSNQKSKGASAVYRKADVGLPPSSGLCQSIRKLPGQRRIWAKSTGEPGLALGECMWQALTVSRVVDEKLNRWFNSLLHMKLQSGTF